MRNLAPRSVCFALALAGCDGGAGQGVSKQAWREVERAETLAAVARSPNPEPASEPEPPHALGSDPALEPTPDPPNGADEAQVGAAQLKTVVEVKGDCVRLIMADEIAPECAGMMVNFIYGSGRSSFLFYNDADNTVVSFTGVSGDDVWQAESIIQPLDGVTITRTADGESKTESLRAIGACRYTNPFVGEAVLGCVAESASGQWLGEFRTDGEPPNVEDFG